MTMSEPAPITAFPEPEAPKPPAKSRAALLKR
jgi:hypothetical protein